MKTLFSCQSELSRLKPPSFLITWYSGMWYSSCRASRRSSAGPSGGGSYG